MKQLFLTSSVSQVAKQIAKTIPNKKLVFIMTAAEVEEGKQWLTDDRSALIAAGFHLTDYSLTGKTEEDVRKDLQSFEIIFFSGGNTFYLLEKIQQSKSTQFFKEQIEKDVIYIGSSAGSIIAGPDIEVVQPFDSIDKAPNLQGFQGLALVDFTILPHWGSDKFKQIYFTKGLEKVYKTNNKTILLRDNQYVYVRDGMYKIVGN